MKIEDNLYVTKLFDAYGPLLTESQSAILQDYLIFDLTGSEIAENKQISRQAVKDAIDKAKVKLVEFESKLHFVEKLEVLERALSDKRRN